MVNNKSIFLGRGGRNSTLCTYGHCVFNGCAVPCWDPVWVLCRDFCRVVYTGAYVNADVIFFSTSPGHLHEYAEHLQHSKRAWPAIVTPVIANKCICIFKLPRAKYSRARWCYAIKFRGNGDRVSNDVYFAFSRRNVERFPIRNAIDSKQDDLASSKMNWDSICSRP